jgi:hypothetical protein
VTTHDRATEGTEERRQKPGKAPNLEKQNKTKQNTTIHE